MSRGCTFTLGCVPYPSLPTSIALCVSSLMYRGAGPTLASARHCLPMRCLHECLVVACVRILPRSSERVCRHRALWQLGFSGSAPAALRDGLVTRSAVARFCLPPAPSGRLSVGQVHLALVSGSLSTQTRLGGLPAHLPPMPVLSWARTSASLPPAYRPPCGPSNLHRRVPLCDARCYSSACTSAARSSRLPEAQRCRFQLMRQCRRLRYAAGCREVMKAEKLSLRSW